MVQFHAGAFISFDFFAGYTLCSMLPLPYIARSLSTPINNVRIMHIQFKKILLFSQWRSHIPKYIGLWSKFFLLTKTGNTHKVLGGKEGENTEKNDVCTTMVIVFKIKEMKFSMRSLFYALVRSF